MKKPLLIVFLLPLLALGCASSNDQFLLQKLDEESKSRAITDVGIDEYNQRLVKLQQLDQIPTVRRYFTIALQYDPTNTQAQQYLGLVDSFKSNKLKANLNNAKKLHAKAKRTDDETYTMYVCLQAAVRIDPANADVQKMLNDTTKDRGALVDSYLQKSKTSLKDVDDKTPPAGREKAYADAFVSANKALDIDPKSGAAQAQVKANLAELTKSVAVRVDGIKRLVAAGKYTDARTQLNALSDLNRKADNNFDTDVRASSYALNWAWASTLYSQKDYANAEVRVNAALVVSRTDEASALKRKIAEQRMKVDSAVSFDQGIQDVDKLTDSGDLVSAHRKIVALDRVTDDPDKQDQLSQRSQTILTKVKDVYDRGVQAYRDEDFKTAIDLLQTVVGVQVDYEQAGDYLDRAKSKQKLLDQY